MPSQQATGFGNGKIIIAGEHAVVLGHPAIALAIDLGTTVTLTVHEGPTTHTAYGTDERLRTALALALPQNGLMVQIETSLRISRGMGSSAALTVALLRARSAMKGTTLTPTDLHRQGFALERVFHGNPSGIDHAVAASGGAMLYRRGPPPVATELPVPPWSLVAIDTNTSADTSVMVAKAAANPDHAVIMREIAALTEEISSCFDNLAEIGVKMTENQDLLRRLGVSTEVLDHSVALALKCGASGAKLAGAGGGGIAIAVTDDPEELCSRLTTEGVDSFVCHPAHRTT